MNGRTLFRGALFMGTVLLMMSTFRPRIQGASSQVSIDPTPTPAALGLPSAPGLAHADIGVGLVVPSHETDLAPQLSPSDKSMLVVQRSDGTSERILLPPGQVTTYVRGLGAARLVAMAPPLSLMALGQGGSVPNGAVSANTSSGAGPSLIPPPTPVR